MMEPWQVRLMAEKSELDEKLVKLFNFLKSDQLSSLDAIDQELLKTQHSQMAGYANTLSRRIERVKASVG